MIAYPLANINAALISVTGTAAALQDLADVAGSTHHAWSPKLNAVDIAVEGGDIRMTIDGTTPTATKGFLIGTGSKLLLRNVPLANVKLIATGAAVNCSIQVGVSEDGETSVIAGAGGGVTGYAADAAHVSTDLGTMALAVRNDAGTSLAGSDLDYIPLTTDSLGNQFETLGTLIEGEDPTNRVMATADKPIIGTTYSELVDISAALEASTISKATAGQFLKVSGRIDSSAPSATYYFLVMNSATLPADGAVTRLIGSIKLQHTTGTDTPILSGDIRHGGVYASAGIVCCLSSTEFTKTISGAYFSGSVFYA